MTYSRKTSGTSVTLPVGESPSNWTGLNLPKLTPVCIDPSTGYVSKVDVSDEEKSRTVYGILAQTSFSGNTADVVTTGRIIDVAVTGNFGDSIYVSKIGGLTNVPPVVGSNGFLSGDFSIEVGFLAKNLANPLQKDLVVRIIQPQQL
jgi:hypothetical protein